MVRSSGRARRLLSMLWVAATALLALGACGAPEPPPADTPAGVFKYAIDLAPMLPPSADVVGIAVTPEGQRYLLDRNSGLYEIAAAGARRVFSTSDAAYAHLSGIGELTDVVALGSERFAMTAVNDGYVLDLHSQTAGSYFCYLPALPDPTGDPGGGPVVPPSVSQTLRNQGIDVQERTESIAFSPDNQQLYAQPQTIRVDTGEIMGSELFVFSDGGGQPIQVWGMPSASFIAGGMVAVDRGLRLVLGTRNELYAMDSGTGPTRIRQFDPSIDISGLALDTNGDLLVLDRAGRRLLATTLY